MRTDVRYGDVGFASAAEATRYSSMPPARDIEVHTDTRLGPVRFSTRTPSLPDFLSHKSGNAGGAQIPFQSTAAVPSNLHLDKMRTVKEDPVSFWVGSSDASAAWDPFQLHDPKKMSKTPSDMCLSLTEELFRLVSMAKCSTYGMMTPNHDTCILR